MLIGGGGNNLEFWADLALGVLASSKLVLAAVFGLGAVFGFVLGKLL